MLWGMVSHYSALKDNYFNAIIVSAMHNYELPITNYDSLRFLFNYRGQYQDYLSITETYLAENNFSEALTSVAQMHEKFKLTEEQVHELVSLQIYVHWLQQLAEKGENIYNLPENEIEYLVNYVETNSGRGVVFANNILCGLYGICIEEGEMSEKVKGLKGEEDDEIFNLREFVQPAASAFQNQALENMKLFPNPGKNEITVISEIENCKFEIIDILGTIQKTINLKRGSNTINTSSLKQGVYIYRIVTDDGVVSGKWLKIN
jgi:hypothetical protein